MENLWVDDIWRHDKSTGPSTQLLDGSGQVAPWRLCAVQKETTRNGLNEDTGGAGLSSSVPTVFFPANHIMLHCLTSQTITPICVKHWSHLHRGCHLITCRGHPAGDISSWDSFHVFLSVLVDWLDSWCWIPVLVIFELMHLGVKVDEGTLLRLRGLELQAFASYIRCICCITTEHPATTSPCTLQRTTLYLEDFVFK